MTKGGNYDYDENSVYEFLGKHKHKDRKNVIYARVSTNKQKQDLINQIKILEEYCIKNGFIIHEIYSDVSSGLNLERNGFSKLLNSIMNCEIENIFITYKDRFSRLSFNILKEIFSRFGCKIIILNEVNDPNNIEKEVISEIIQLIHSFSMKLYSSRRKDKLQLIKKDLELEEK